MRYTSSNTFIASAVGVGSVGGAFFGVPGAIVGLVLGFGLGYWSESESQRTAGNGKVHPKHKAQA